MGFEGRGGNFRQAFKAAGLFTKLANFVFLIPICGETSKLNELVVLTSVGVSVFNSLTVESVCISEPGEKDVSICSGLPIPLNLVDYSLICLGIRNCVSC